MGKRFLIACDQVLNAGGVLRFERSGRHLARKGHEIAYLALSGNTAAGFATEFPILNPEAAAAATWDVTMIPGQAFPMTTIESFPLFQDPRYGLRVQHILNDQRRRQGFLRVNQTFKPDLVVFNNRAWKPGDFLDFSARKFHFLEGAVDAALFHPRPGNAARERTRDADLVVGTQSKKSNLIALSKAVSSLPRHIRLHVFGTRPTDMQLLSAGINLDRVRFFGALKETELRDFYHDCDVVVHAEAFAGWANMAAEAMACGVPVICSRPGTEAFARHLDTAWVLDEPSPAKIAEAISALEKDPELARTMALRALDAIASFSWEDYAQNLLDICDDDGSAHHTYAPEYGLFGKWPIGNETEGLQGVMAACRGKSVLDLGCAEGIVAMEALKCGASQVHGFDADADRIRQARRLCKTFDAAQFRTADLGRWPEFITDNTDILRDRYDIVLYLGLHHHLPQETRTDVLSALLGMTSEMIAIGMPEAVWQADNLDAVITDAGFALNREAGFSPASQDSLFICRREEGRRQHAS